MTEGSRPRGATKSDGRRRPAFAACFPRSPELDAVVDAFESGDYVRVRREGAKLAAGAEADAVRGAAEELVERTKPDWLGVAILVLTAALLAWLSIYWWSRDEPAKESTPVIERVK